MVTSTPKPGKLHHALHLQHHRHTGRKLHHRHTSYRGLAAILVLAALSMVGLNMLARATADSLSASGDLYVYARNAAPVPPTGATITSPKDGSVTIHGSATVSGTCPVITPGVIIAITDNGAMAGSTTCDTSGTFSVGITLTPGPHTFIAKTYTITDDTAPDSAPVTIRYDAVAPPPPPLRAAPNPTKLTSQPEPLVLAINRPFIVFGPAKDALWTGTITGGSAPYTARINWGDGTTKTYKLTKPGEQSFSHHYSSMRPHDITFRVNSSDGQYVTRHYAAVTPYVPPVGFGTIRSPWNGSWPWGLYGMYLLLLALFGYVWYRRHPFAYAKVRVHHRYYTAKKRKSPRR